MSWNSGVMTSLRNDWATPRSLFEMLDLEFGFKIDVCATETTAACPLFYDQHGLTRSWQPGPAWCNPPYGRKIGNWIEKGYRESRSGATVVMLLPARTDTSWWHDYCMKGEIRLLRGRLRFDETKKDAPFPSAVVVFRHPLIFPL